jgi:hypothetical protein
VSGDGAKIVWVVMAWRAVHALSSRGSNVTLKLVRPAASSAGVLESPAMGARLPAKKVEVGPRSSKTGSHIFSLSRNQCDKV